jgi:hypothetical protein
MQINFPGRFEQFLFYRQKAPSLNVLLTTGRSSPSRDSGGIYISFPGGTMTTSYESILKRKILNLPANALARKLGISKITADWLKNTVKEKHQQIVKNELNNLSTDNIAKKLDIPLELATWLKDTLEKEAKVDRIE